jgi:hypothetical protein
LKVHAVAATIVGGQSGSGTVTLAGALGAPTWRYLRLWGALQGG